MSESAEQMHKRLCNVISAARFEVLSQPYAWEQVSEPSRLPANALAVVRDGSAWYALTSVSSNSTGAYRILVLSPRRRGVGTGFIGELRKIASERNVYVIFVQADTEDGPAIALYESLGTKESAYHFDIEVPTNPVPTTPRT